MDDRDLAWLAGLLEGEGCFFIQRSKKDKPRIAIALEMTDEDIIAKVASLWEVKSYHAYNRGKDPRIGFSSKTPKTIYRVRLSDKKARAFIAEVYPLMGERRRAKIDYILAETA